MLASANPRRCPFCETRKLACETAGPYRILRWVWASSFTCRCRKCGHFVRFRRRGVVRRMVIVASVLTIITLTILETL